MTHIAQQHCRDWMHQPWELEFTKDGRPRRTNQYPTTCNLCGDHLESGEAIVGSFDKATNRIKWSCGPKRWERP